MTTYTHRRHWRLGISAGLITAVALGGSISAQARQGRGRGVTVYADINYRGESATFRNDTPNLASAGWNDAISSVRVPNGETWEICQDNDYRSRCQTLSGDVADLRTMGWNDRISSLRRIDNAGARDRARDGWNASSDSSVTVYVNANFGGQSTFLRGATPNLVPYRINDKVSSIRITNGETWEVCQDIDYGGQCQRLSASVADLRTIGWNDRISSLRPVNDAGFRDWPSGDLSQTSPDRGLLFFDRPGFTGRSALVRAGSPNVEFSARQGSVQLRGGGVWELCDISGNCVTINQDVADVSRLGLKVQITSARLVNTNPYRRNHDDQ
jgi:Beta/Gamma crystallin